MENNEKELLEKEAKEITEEESKEKEEKGKTTKSNKKSNKEKNTTEEKDKNSENEKDKNIKWSVGTEEDGNVHVRPIESKEENEESKESEEEITEEEVKAVAKAIIEEAKDSKRSIQSIVKELAGVKEEIEEIETPKGFTKKQELNKKEYGYHNGRKYLKLKNGFGMWADNGQSFSLNDLD